MKPLVFRSTPAFVLAWVWMAFAAGNLVDIVLRGRDLASLIAAASISLGAGVAYVVGLRPRIVADATGVRLHNPLRDIRLPWSAVDKIELTDAIGVHSGDRTFRAYALQASPRARLRAEVKSRRDSALPDHVAKYVRGRLPVDFAVDRLNELAAQSRRDSATTAPPSDSLSWPAVASLVVPVLVLAVSVVIAVLR